MSPLYWPQGGPEQTRKVGKHTTFLCFTKKINFKYPTFQTPLKEQNLGFSFSVKSNSELCLINRPGVAGAVLQHLRH